MKLESITFNQYYQSETNINTWILDDFLLQNVNLIVGKNASGKTRALNIMSTLANLLSGHKTEMPSDHSCFKIVFRSERGRAVYELCYREKKVYKEKYRIGKKVFLNRREDGKGVIFAEQLKKKMKFQVPESNLACVFKRDSVQHPYFEELYKWGDSLRHYKFGEKMGKDHLAIFEKKDDKSRVGEETVSPKETSLVVGIFDQGVKKFGDNFKSEIIKGMEFIGYDIEDIDIELSGEVKIVRPIKQTPHAIYVKERDLEDRTAQFYISQGMFRALSLIIQINYSIFEEGSCFILIDDVGEGLDFDRSSSLINYIVEKIEGTDIQLVMSTNDRFVMNTVPLKYWSIILREGAECRVYNYKNSKKIFNDFEYTGMANFDMLTTEFYKSGFSDK